MQTQALYLVWFLLRYASYPVQYKFSH
jgi:integral membrane sensor domain MASE1